MIFKHHDPDRFHGQELTLHDCKAEKIFCENQMLRFCFPEGVWITDGHPENRLQKTVRTDAAVVEVHVDDIEDVTIDVFVPGWFGKTTVCNWSVNELAKNINSGTHTLEFIDLYRSYSEQLWVCELHSAKKPYHQRCHLYLPGADAVFHWNVLRSDCTW